MKLKDYQSFSIRSSFCNDTQSAASDKKAKELRETRQVFILFESLKHH